MSMTMMGSQYWPLGGQGFLAIYAFAVFGYVTGAIATYFIGQGQDHGEAPCKG